MEEKLMQSENNDLTCSLSFYWLSIKNWAEDFMTLVVYIIEKEKSVT